MKGILAVTNTYAGWCLSLLLTVLMVQAAEPKRQNPSGPTGSEPFRPRELNLEAARTIAFQKNWDLLAAHSGIDLATAQLIVAKEFPNPVLSWTTMKVDPRGN